MAKISSPQQSSEMLSAPPPVTAQDVGLVRLLLNTGRDVESVVSTGSMGRAVPVGSRIRIQRCVGRMPSCGEVVAFLAGNRIVVHRVVYAGMRGAAREFLITRGDADWLCDPPVHIGLVVGCVEQMSTGEQWHRIEAAQQPTRHPVLSSLARSMLAMALEASPRSAAALGRLMFSLRVRLRRLLGRLSLDQRDDVRA